MYRIEYLIQPLSYSHFYLMKTHRNLHVDLLTCQVVLLVVALVINKVKRVK